MPGLPEHTQRPDFSAACWERIAKPIGSPEDNSSTVVGDDEIGLEWSARGELLSSSRLSSRGGDGDGPGGETGVSGDRVVNGGGEIGQMPPVPNPMCLMKIFGLFQHDRTVKDVLREAEGVEGFAEEIDHRRWSGMVAEGGEQEREMGREEKQTGVCVCVGGGLNAGGKTNALGEGETNGTGGGGGRSEGRRGERRC